MNELTMALQGSDASGWIWSVAVDGVDLFRTLPLDRGDLELGLFEIQRDAHRRNPVMYNLPRESAFFLLNGFFQGPLTELLRASAEEQTWARHAITPSLPAVISTDMYLIEGEKRDRLIVVERGDIVKEFWLVCGNFDNRLAEIRARLSAGQVDGVQREDRR